jgi:hypothetical protein
MELIFPNYFSNLALLLIEGELHYNIATCFSFAWMVFLTVGVLFFTIGSFVSKAASTRKFKFL